MTGGIWAVGVIAEVLLFWQFGRIMHLLSWRAWVIVSLVLTALRWLLTGVLIDSLPSLFILQILHAFSFGVMHAVSMRYVQKLFPDHQPIKDENLQTSRSPNLYNQVSPLLCKYEKRNGRPTLIIEGFEGENINHLKKISSKLKQRFSVGGSVKNQTIIIQGNIRDKVMNYLSEIGFKVKRVGG